MNSSAEKTAVIPATEQDPEGLVRFSKPYHFEGRDYTEIDLSGLENITARDMIAAEKYLFKSGLLSPMPDQTAEYICFIAGKVSEQPIEFFKGLPPKDFNRVKNKITNFFYGED